MTAMPISVPGSFQDRRWLVESFPAERGSLATITALLQSLEARWSVDRDVLEPATIAAVEAVEAVLRDARPMGPIEIKASYDGRSLRIAVRYNGRRLDLQSPETRVPSYGDTLAAVPPELSRLIVTSLADVARSRAKGSQSVVELRFRP